MPTKFKCVRSGAEVFWGEIAPCEHLVQIYTDDEGFMDSLEGFIGGGLKAGEAVIVIASAAHRSGLESRLAERGVDLAAARATDQYIAIDADEMLAQFMVNGWPDDALFGEAITKIITRARTNNRRVRAFGEMVAHLWAQGACGATVRLEHLWNEFLHVDAFSLFCAYPKSGFTETSAVSFREICSAHSKMISAAA